MEKLYDSATGPMIWNSTRHGWNERHLRSPVTARCVRFLIDPDLPGWHGGGRPSLLLPVERERRETHGNGAPRMGEEGRRVGQGRKKRFSQLPFGDSVIVVGTGKI